MQKKNRWKLLAGLLFFLLSGVAFSCSRMKEQEWSVSLQQSQQDSLVLQSAALEPEVQQAGSGTASESFTNVSSEEAAEITAQAKLVVYICGQVASPGVYSFSEGARVVDALDAAGGFLEGAADTWWNLAQPLVDGMQIYIPTQEEAAGSTSPMTQAADSGFGAAAELTKDEGLIDINQADQAALMTLPGIGEAKAEAIIQYREQHGSFQTKEDIMLVPGIKEAAYAKIAERITVR